MAEKLKSFIEDPDAPHSVRLTALGKASDLLGHNAKTQEHRSDTVFILSDADRKKLDVERKQILNGNNDIVKA